jgi:peptidoglycan-associated lipoprotein
LANAPIPTWKLAALVGLVISLAACANNPNQPGLAGTATPGSPLDFVVNVGDRVFFETDQTDLTQQARATLDKQAQWLAIQPLQLYD